ncbi:MAG: ATP-binding protein [Acidimicrobiia bacterium]
MRGVQDVHDEQEVVRDAATRRFAPDARSVRDARAFVTDVLEQAHDTDDVIMRAVMIVSELAGNAVLHAATTYAVRIGRRGDTVRGEVADANGQLPRRASRPRETGGRGLLIVAAAADRWGVRREAGGKIVWFEIDETG